MSTTFYVSRERKLLFSDTSGNKAEWLNLIKEDCFSQNEIISSCIVIANDNLFWFPQSKVKSSIGAVSPQDLQRALHAIQPFLYLFASVFLVHPPLEGDSAISPILPRAAFHCYGSYYEMLWDTFYRIIFVSFHECKIWWVKSYVDTSLRRNWSYFHFYRSLSHSSLWIPPKRDIHLLRRLPWRIKEMGMLSWFKLYLLKKAARQGVEMPFGFYTEISRPQEIGSFQGVTKIASHSNARPPTKQREGNSR